MLCRLMYGFWAQDKQPNQPRALGGRHLGKLGGRDQVLGVVEDDAQADPFRRVDLHEDALDELVQERQDHVGVAGPRLGLADPVVQAREHPPQAIAVAAGGGLEPQAQVVLENDVPLPEELGRQELGNAAVGEVPSRSWRVRSWTLPWSRKTHVVPAKNWSENSRAQRGNHGQPHSRRLRRRSEGSAWDSPGAFVGRVSTVCVPQSIDVGLLCGLLGTQISGSGARVLVAGPSSLVDCGVLGRFGRGHSVGDLEFAQGVVGHRFFDGDLSLDILDALAGEVGRDPDPGPGSYRSGLESSTRPGRSRLSRRNGTGWRARPLRPRPGSS